MRRGASILLCVCVVWGHAGKVAARFLEASDVRDAPRPRVACHPSPTAGTRYVDVSRLGPHRYRFSFREQNGIVYTARGGHIDITHVRKAADWSAYLAYQLRETLRDNKPSYSYRMREPSIYHVRIRYPQGWAALPEDVRQRIATDVSIDLGRYLSFVGTTWHEMLTWFGFKSAGFYSEYPSAFSWEDNYSNLLGSHLGALAARDPRYDYDRAMTVALAAELRRLRAQPPDVAKAAGEAVRDWWFVSGFVFCDMLKRHLDIGTGDGCVTPWVVPGFCDDADCLPISYGTPNLEFLDEYGFSVDVEIEPREWERHKIFRILYPVWGDREPRIVPARHFGPILETIRAEAISRYGLGVDGYAKAARDIEQPFVARSAELGRLAYARPDSGDATVITASIVYADGLPSRCACPGAIIGDVNGDCRLSKADFAEWAAHWLEEDISPAVLMEARAPVTDAGTVTSGY